MGPDLPEDARSYTKSARIRDGLSIVVSGQSKNSYFYDHDNLMWTKGPTMSNQRYSFSLGMLQDINTREILIFASGGFNSGVGIMKSTEILKNNTWIQKDVAMAEQASDTICNGWC